MSDALTMSARSVRLSMRHLDALITSLLLPVMLMLLFVELFGGAIETGAGRYVTYVVPGVILLCARLRLGGDGGERRGWRPRSACSRARPRRPTDSRSS